MTRVDLCSCCYTGVLWPGCAPGEMTTVAASILTSSALAILATEPSDLPAASLVSGPRVVTSRGLSLATSERRLYWATRGWAGLAAVSRTVDWVRELTCTNQGSARGQVTASWTAGRRGER